MLSYWNTFYKHNSLSMVQPVSFILKDKFFLEVQYVYISKFMIFL